jgi:ubiquitin carboxyl-terminal hydrolase 10
MCFANVALQLLVYCPQFWNQLRYMSRLIIRRGEPKGQQTGGARTVLVDATFRFLDEFMHKEKTSLTERSLQLAQKGKAREDETIKKEDNDIDPFIPSYVYDAMKEKKQLKRMLVRTCAHIALFCY